MHTATPNDYDVVKRTIAFLSRSWREQPSLDTIAEEAGLSPFHLERVFSRWAGLTPKAFVQALTIDHAKKLLRGRASVLDAAYDSGLSGPGRLHDLFVTHEGVTPGAFKERGAGLDIRHGFHDCPFGRALIMTTERGVCGIGFADAGEEAKALADMKARWPAASYIEDEVATAPVAQRIFEPQRWRGADKLKLIMIGTDFEIRVWESLLRIPAGKMASYADVARSAGRPKAARAVGAAVGRNPLSFVVPCHRVVGTSGGLTGYHWGLTRKRAILGWEAGLAA